MAKQHKQCQRPRGYWHDWNNLERELREVMTEIRRFPGRRDLKAVGRSDLIHSFEYHGGLSAVRKKMGYECSTKPKGYWKHWSNFERELREVIVELGRFPYVRDLQATGRGDIINATKHYGGFSVIRARMGYGSPSKITKPRKRHGYWQDWNNLERELRGAVAKLGRFPVRRDLMAMGRGDLISATEHHGGLPAVREKMGCGCSTKPKGYWKQRCACSRKSSGYWQDWSNLERELREVIAELGRFPGRRDLKAMGRGDLNSAIRHHGGFSAIRARMGYGSPPKSREFNGYWQDWGNLERELRAVIAELGRFPKQRELIAMGRGNLIDATNRNYGGLPTVRDRMGYGSPKKPQKPHGYWQDWGNLERELRAVIAELGRFPKQRELRAMGRGNLISAIRHHGNFPAVREKMGFPPAARALTTKIESVSSIPGLTMEDRVAIAKTLPALAHLTTDVLIGHLTRLNLGPLQFPTPARDGGGVAFWVHCIAALEKVQPDARKLTASGVPQRIAARLYRAAAVEVLGREPLTREEESRVVVFLMERAQQCL